MVMSIVFHLTVNIKFCICLAVYKYTSNVSRSRTTLASLLGPTALQLPRGHQHWLRGSDPETLGSSCSRSGGNSLWQALRQLSTPVLLRISLCKEQQPPSEHKLHEKRSQLIKQAVWGPCCPAEHSGFPCGQQLREPAGQLFFSDHKAAVTLTFPFPNFHGYGSNPSQGQWWIIKKASNTQLTKFFSLCDFMKQIVLAPMYFSVV